MFKKIVAFGDSWVYGDELFHPDLVRNNNLDLTRPQNIMYRENSCFSGLLAKHYNVPVENFGIPGGSNQSTIWNYIWWLEHEVLPLDQCLVLVGITDAARNSFIDASLKPTSLHTECYSYVHTMWVHHGPETQDPWKDMIKQYTVLSLCDELFRLNYLQTLLFFQGQSLKIPLLQFNTIGCRYPDCYPSLLWPDNSLLDILNNHEDQKIFAKNWHPNEQGHKILADLLISQIDSCILHEC